MAVITSSPTASTNDEDSEEESVSDSSMFAMSGVVDDIDLTMESFVMHQTNSCSTKLVLLSSAASEVDRSILSNVEIECEGTATIPRTTTGYMDLVGDDPTAVVGVASQEILRNTKSKKKKKKKKGKKPTTTKAKAAVSETNGIKMSTGKSIPQAPVEPPAIDRYASILRMKRLNDDKKQTSTSMLSSQRATTMVQFGRTHVREMKRGISFDTVPTDNGSFPLGLSEEIIQEYDLSVDEYVQRKGINKKVEELSSSSPGEMLSKLRMTTTTNKESSFPSMGGSFCNKQLEPLSETNRKIILLSSLDPNYRFEEELKIKKKEKNSTKNHHSRRTSTMTTTRRNKVASATSAASTSSASLKNPSYHNMELEHLLCVVIRKDLERITIDRSVTGCNCCKRSSKHHHHHPLSASTATSMNDRKLREELRKRKLLLPHENNNTRILPEKKQELFQRLQHAMEQEPCCREDNCPCVQNGIPCHELACKCFCSSSSTAHHHHSNPTAFSSASSCTSSINGNNNDDKNNRCGNIYGLDIVDIDRIQKKRAEFCTV